MPPDAVSPDVDDLPVADMAAATMAAFAITAACLKARATGLGDHIDLGMADVLAHWVGTVPEASPPRRGPDDRRHGPVPGYGVYTTKDGGGITLGVVSEQRLWAATCRALGLVEHVDVPFAERVERVRELDAVLADAIARLTRDEAVDLLYPAGAPVAPLLTRAEMMAHGHFQARGVIAEDTVGVPVRTAVHPPLPPGPVPELDEHHGETWHPAPA
jgi:crotonobetainyl-CoA:carnitine CoA-transferase CaiB-like acyl-CoA transferase